MEALLADVLLWREGLMGAEECRAEVDRLFLEDPEDELLLELEWGFRDMKGLAARVWRYWGEHTGEFSAEAFGRVLMGRIREVYYGEGLDIRAFAGRMYSLWKGLPPWLQKTEPFWTLCYADDPLSWDDEAQTRALYENMLRYYDGDGV